MFDKIKYTLKHSAIYGLGNLSSKILGFILLPIYFHYLTIEEYGILAIFEITSQILTEVLLISIPTSLIRWYAAENKIDVKKSIVFTSFAFITILAVLLSIFLIPFSSLFSSLFFDTAKYSIEFTFLFLWVSLALIDRTVLSLIRVKQKSIFFVILSTIKLIIILLLNIYFVVFKEYGIRGILLSQVIGHFFAILISSIFVAKNSSLKFNLPILKEMLKYGFPLIFSTVSSLALSLGDRYIIKIFLGDAAVGIYNAGYKIASLINMLINQPFQLGFLPIAFNQVDKPNSSRFYSKVLTYLTLILSSAFLFVGLFGGNIIDLITNKIEYLKSIPLIPFIALSFVFKGIQYVFGLGFHYVKMTKYNAYLVLTASLLNIGLNIMLVPIYGIYAAVIVMNFSMLFLIIITYYFAQKKYFIEYEILKLFKITLTSIVLVIVSSFVLNSLLSETYLFLIKVSAFISFPFILYFLHFFEDVELERLKGSWKKWKNPAKWKSNLKEMNF